MKKVFIVFMMMFICMPFFGCTEIKSNINNDVIRIHIRANSNDDTDQNIKLSVRDEVINYITPLLVNCKDSEDVKKILQINLPNIESVSNNVLSKNNFDYSANAKLSNEYFPSRSYNGKVFKADYYDALIINLGSGSGNNWWCVAYPPLCFIGEDNGNNSIQYKSKLLELINNFFGG